MKTKTRILIAILFFAISPFGVVKAYDCANFTALQTAFTNINNGTYTGDILIRLTGNIAMGTNTLTINASGTGGANYTSITISTSATNRTISGTTNGAFFILDGADGVTFDGTAATMMKIYNTGSGASACLFEFKNGACNNYIKNCNLYASSGFTGDGLIKFTTTNTTKGNDDNTIQNCILTNTSSGKPIVYSLGTADYPNKGNKIANNTIDKYIKVGSSSKAIAILDNSDSWEISGNSFFESGALTGGNFDYYAIYIHNTGGKYSIRENYFGGRSASCGGSAFTISGTATSRWVGIYLNVTTTGTSSDIEKNIFRNINISSGNSTPFCAIYINDGKVKLSSVGAVSANHIGHTSSNTAANGISITNISSNSTSYGIFNQSNVATEIYETQMGNISVIGSTDFSHNFIGIYKTGSGSTTINNNIIGSTSISNSIYSSATATSGNQSVFGIYSNGSGQVTITSNTIANMSNDYAEETATDGKIIGILADNGVNTIQFNKIFNLNTTSPSNGNTGTTASLIGISMLSTNEGQKVNSNTIYGLTNNNAVTSISSCVFGIFYEGPSSGTNKIDGNFIHGLNITADESTAEISGIRINAGTSTYSNNIINLGYDVTTGAMIQGIYENGPSGNDNKIYFNTIYLSGNPLDVSGNTYCLFNNANTNNRNFRNNILYNARNGGTGATHYAISISGLSSLTIDYNDYLVTGSGGILASISGVDKNTLEDIQTATSQDANSLNNDPLFNTEGGTESYSYYPLATTIDGIAISSVESDFDLGIRDTPPTMGALEGINKWLGLEDESFENANNWTLKSVPVSGEDVRFHAFPYNNCVLQQNKIIGSYMNAQSQYYLDLNGYELTLQKSIIVSNGGYMDASTVGGSKIIFKGSVSQSISAGSFLNNQILDIEVDNSNGVVLGEGDFKIKGTYTKTNGLFDVFTNHSTLFFNGENDAQTIPESIFTNNKVYNLTIENPNNVTLNGTLKVAGSLSVNSGALDATTNSTTIEFVGIEGPQDIPASFFTDNKAYNIKISNTDGLYLGGDLSIENELFINSGPVFINGSLLTLNGTVNNTLEGGLIGSSTSSLYIGGTSGKSIQLNQNEDEVGNYSLYNLTIDCSGSVTLPTNNYVYIYGTLSKSAGSLTASNGNTFEFIGSEGKQTIPNGFFTGNLISNIKVTNVDGAAMGGNLEVDSILTLESGSLTMAGTLTLSGDLVNTISNGLIGSSSSSLVIGGTSDKSIQLDQNDPANYSLNNITLNCSGAISIPSDNNITFYGALTKTEGSLTANSNNTIAFAGSSAQTIPANFFTNNSITNITINNSSNVTLYGTLKISGTMTKTAGYLDAYSQLPFVELNGSSTQTIPTGFLKDSKVANLKINNSSDVIIEDDVIITSQLNLGIGDIITDDNAVVVQDNAIVINADENSYIYGNCSKIGDEEFTFPVGSATVYAPLTITAPMVNTTKFTAYYRSADPEIAIGSNKSSNVDSVNSCQYWDLHRDFGCCNVQISLAWSSENNCDINAENVGKVSVLHWNVNKWELVDNDTIVGCETLGCITSKTVSSFSPFTLGFEKISSLPVSLTSFVSDCKDNSTILEWKTATEINNNYFEVQRSSDGKNWDKVAQVKGAGNSNQILNYSYLDKNNDGTFMYYRLKQVDFNGNFAISNQIVSNCNASNPFASMVRVYPNPANDNLNIFLSKVLENSEFTISNSFGQEVIKGKISTETTNLDVSKLMNGIYYIKISGIDKTYKFTKF